MSCDNVAFDGFQAAYTKDQIHLRNNIYDLQVCINLCSVHEDAKSYFFNKQTKDCHCYSRPFAENEKLIFKIGAPKGCPASFIQGSCVSTKNIQCVSGI
jgi:hypothetical protein